LGLWWRTDGNHVSSGFRRGHHKPERIGAQGLADGVAGLKAEGEKILMRYPAAPVGNVSWVLEHWKKPFRLLGLP